MPGSEKQTAIPRFAYVSDEAAARIARSTKRGVYNLSLAERFWQSRHDSLKEHGYLLRPRYTPDWEPSWTGTNRTPIFCEDSIILEHSDIIDAKRIVDNRLVAIKRLDSEWEEVRIAEYLTSMHDSRNHCAPALDIFLDPLDARHTFLVMPYLRAFNDPNFGTVGEVIDFVDQTLEGLAFMHRHLVAHRDVSSPNIMMDARPLYPHGHHPVRRDYTPDCFHRVSALSRTDHPVQYFFIDFGISTRFSEGSSTFVVGDVGRDRDVPEMSEEVPYDAFKVDVFSLGHVYSEEFEKKYNSMEFLLQLIDPMMEVQPERRPSMEDILLLWNNIKATLSESLYRWRLGPKSEPAIERAFNNTVAVAWEGLYHLKRLVR